MFSKISETPTLLHTHFDSGHSLATKKVILSHRRKMSESKSVTFRRKFRRERYKPDKKYSRKHGHVFRFISLRITAIGSSEKGSYQPS